MTSLPLSFFKGCATTTITSPKEKIKEPKKKPSLASMAAASRFTNNNDEQNVTKFTIGTSDEDDEDSNDESSRDLENLFCPLTDTNGAPLEDRGEQLSASSCRRVQSEIMASLSSFKSSILGRKGGLLHTYAMMESMKGSLSSTGSVPESLDSSTQATPIKVIPPTPRHPKSRGKSQGAIRRSKSPGPHQALLPNSITVSLPSPAGNRKQSLSKSMSNGGVGTKKWDKYNKVKKAIKPYTTGFAEPPLEPRSRIGSSASNSSLKLFDSGSETPPMRHGSIRRGNKKKKKTGSKKLKDKLSPTQQQQSA